MASHSCQCCRCCHYCLLLPLLSLLLLLHLWPPDPPRGLPPHPLRLLQGRHMRRAAGLLRPMLLHFMVPLLHTLLPLLRFRLLLLLLRWRRRRRQRQLLLLLLLLLLQRRLLRQHLQQLPKPRVLQRDHSIHLLMSGLHCGLRQWC